MTRFIPCFSLFVLLLSATPAFAAKAAPSAEEVEPLEIGDSIPDVTLHNQEGEQVDLKETVSEKPAVIVFYRGDWCRYCNMHLRNLKEVEPKLVDLGYDLFAIGADRAEKLSETDEKEDLPYTLLSDSKMEAAQGFGVAFKVPDQIIEKYKDYDIDLEKASGEDHHLLPVPSVFVVDQAGKIKYRYYNPDYTVRLESKDLLEAAKEAKEKGSS